MAEETERERNGVRTSQENWSALNGLRGPHSDRAHQEASLEGLVATDRVWLESVDITLRGNVTVPSPMFWDAPLQNNVLCEGVWTIPRACRHNVCLEDAQPSSQVCDYF